MTKVPRQKNRRMASFDGMRGLAALLVLFFHVGTWTKVGYLANYTFIYKNPLLKVLTVTPLKLLWSGNEAVILFYIIGGFVITKPYIEGRSLHFISFFKKRFTRLVIPYWMILIVTFLCMALFGKMKEGIVLSRTFNTKWSSFPSLWEMVGHFLMWDSHLNVVAGAFWSIVQEWRISLMMPFIGMLLYRYPTWKVLTGTLLLNRVSAFFLQVAPSLHRTNYYFLYFLVGAVLCKHIGSSRAWFRQRRWLGFFIPLLIPFQWAMIGLGIKFSRREALLVTAIGFVLLILATLESRLLTWIFESRPLLFLGRISYSLYLTHSTFIMLFTTVFGQVVNPTVVLLLSPLFAVWFANLWYLKVERGLLQDLFK